MESERRNAPTYRILGSDTPEHASIIQKEMERLGVDVTIISKSDDLHKYANVEAVKKNNVVMVIDVPVNINTVEMFQRMHQCLQNAS